MKKLFVLIILVFAVCSCEKDSTNKIEEEKSITLPVLTSSAVSEITETSVKSGGNITNDGGAPITARGICWSTSANPTTSDNSTLDGTNAGSFTSSLNDLVENTIYYLRAYATNSEGTSYGNELSFKTLEKPELVIEGDVNLRTQEMIDNFGAYGYERVSGNLLILASFGSNINSLKPLEGLNTVDGDFYIANTNLTDFEGLNNLAVVGGNIQIQYNNKLSSMGDLISLKEIGGFLDIDSNPSLKNLDGLENLTTISRWLGIDFNETLENIDALSNLKSIEYGLTIQSNPALKNINGLSSLTSVGYELTIDKNALITNLDGLKSLTKVGSYIVISYNDALTNILGLNKLEIINDRLVIHNNNSLINLDGLENIVQIDDFLGINSNKSLVEINGLNNLSTLNGKLIISHNLALNNFCGIKPLIDNGFSNSFDIASNSFNPTQQDILNGNCSE